MKCPECGTTMTLSKWTGNSHCDNLHCTVTVKPNGEIYHRPYALADMGEKARHGARIKV